jgi:hypothetical protein
MALVASVLLAMGEQVKAQTIHEKITASRKHYQSNVEFGRKIQKQIDETQIAHNEAVKLADKKLDEAQYYFKAAGKMADLGMAFENALPVPVVVPDELFKGKPLNPLSPTSALDFGVFGSAVSSVALFKKAGDSYNAYNDMALDQIAGVSQGKINTMREKLRGFTERNEKLGKEVEKMEALVNSVTGHWHAQSNINRWTLDLSNGGLAAGQKVNSSREINIHGTWDIVNGAVIVSYEGGKSFSAQITGNQLVLNGIVFTK